MNRNEILKTIKEQFKKLMFASSTNFTTTDGQNLLVIGEDATVGCEVFLLDADNNQTPLDNGDYILSDGRTITVTDGKISAVQAAAPAEAQTPDTEMADAPTTEPVTETPAEGTVEDTDTEQRLTDLENVVNQILELLQSQGMFKEQMMSSIKNLTERVETIANQPDGDKINVKKKTFSSSKPDFKNDLSDIRKIVAERATK